MPTLAKVPACIPFVLREQIWVGVIIPNIPLSRLDLISAID